MGAGADGLELTLADGVVAAVLDRGEGNLLTVEICAALTALLLDPPKDAHVLRLSARGPAFCLGRERAATAPLALRDETRTLTALNQALVASPLVSVAAVSGDAAGFGVGLAALCDVAIAADTAHLSFPEIEIDLAPAVVLAWLPRVVGRRMAFHLTATGRRVPAAEAVALGLLNAAVPATDLERAVDAEIAALRTRTPRVHGDIKSFLAATADASAATANAMAEDRLVLGALTRSRHE
jgi:methylglutaconyl-CoA hydratase